ncbi:T7SS effector LXG polymorphic toxin, partial [Metabacillus mangrovi]
MKKRTDQYNELDDQFTALKTAFQEIVDNTELQGKGADNIKRFYQAQIKLVGDWQDVIEGLTGFFESIPGRMEDADLNNRTKVAVPFLEEQLQSGADKSRQMVDQQHSELGKILDTIRDILPISSFSLDSFKKNMEEADKERAGAAQAVIGFDEGYLGVYYLNALSNLEGVSAGYDAIRSATSSGDGTIQPIHFNQKIYDEHIVHDVRESVEEKLDSFKYEEKKLKEFRIEKAKMEEEMAKIKAEQEKPAHEKIFSGITTVAGELTGVNDIIRATTGVDPVTGNKLTEAERVKAAGMAAAGFIPVVGWGGRAARGVYKGGKAIEGMVTADRALDAYKTTAGMQKLAQAEKGIYGLTVANSGYE